jgi:hypothetical protein
MWVDTGKRYVCDIMTVNRVVETIQCGLYTLPVTWGPGTLLSDLVEPTSSAYSRQDTGEWDAATINGADQGYTAAPAVEFNNDLGTVYVAQGWFFVTKNTGTLLCGAAFPTPQPVLATIGALVVGPQLTSCVC